MKTSVLTLHQLVGDLGVALSALSAFLVLVRASRLSLSSLELQPSITSAFSEMVQLLSALLKLRPSCLNVTLYEKLHNPVKQDEQSGSAGAPWRLQRSL